MSIELSNQQTLTNESASVDIFVSFEGFLGMLRLAVLGMAASQAAPSAQAVMGMHAHCGSEPDGGGAGAQAVDELARNQYCTPFLNYVASDISASWGPALEQLVKGAPLEFKVTPFLILDPGRLLII